MTRVMDIRIGVGIGPVRFGMTMDQVAALVPGAEVYEMWMGGNLDADRLLYHGLRFGFSSRNPAEDAGLTVGLTQLTVRGREDARLLGRPVEDWTRGQIVDALRGDGHDVEHLANGDVNVCGSRTLLELSFDGADKLISVCLEGVGS